ncbi:MAG TPA: dienelactone hydrolase family protein [Thermoplasmata archaeon]|nr:dienelactone hydrolase family protein [Thermoplasmata archaeon]
MPRAQPIIVPTGERDLEAFLGLPVGGKTPHRAVVVIHEIFGPDAHIRSVVDRFATEGYVALAPNLFTGEIQGLLTPAAVTASMTFLRSLPPEVQRDPQSIRARIAERPPGEREALEAMFRIQDPSQQRRFGKELVEVAEYLRRRPDVDPRWVGAVGFCFGGSMTGLLAGMDPHLAAAVIFYGNNPPADLVPAIRCPVLGHYGGEDHRITDTVPELVKRMAEADVPFNHYVYPGAAHAFFNDARPTTYQPEAARLAWDRTLRFFEMTMGDDGPA